MRLVRLVCLAATLFAPVAAARAASPTAYCRRVGVDDTVRPIPASLVPAARRLFALTAPDSALQRTTLFRCMGGTVQLCAVGADLPCGKANTSRDAPGAVQYCRENPGASFIPMFVTGQNTIYRWRCAGTQAVPGAPVERLDARNFIARLWKPAD